MEWNELEWSGVEWSEPEWSGVNWSGAEWSGVNWSQMKTIFFIQCFEGRAHTPYIVSLNALFISRVTIDSAFIGAIEYPPEIG